MKKILKEKEQENRISKLKIKEMRRLIKHKQLRPIQKEPEADSMQNEAGRFKSSIPKVKPMGKAAYSTKIKSPEPPVEGMTNI